MTENIPTPSNDPEKLNDEDLSEVTGGALYQFFWDNFYAFLETLGPEGSNRREIATKEILEPHTGRTHGGDYDCYKRLLEYMELYNYPHAQTFDWECRNAGVW